MSLQFLIGLKSNQDLKVFVVRMIKGSRLGGGLFPLDEIITQVRDEAHSLGLPLRGFNSKKQKGQENALPVPSSYAVQKNKDRHKNKNRRRGKRGKGGNAGNNCNKEKCYKYPEATPLHSHLGESRMQIFKIAPIMPLPTTCSRV